ncbi:unnamed protein product [Ilex paraguariensis]|uniref:Uncharacterized protein n=1 Tax=Ilex paraguariensis TaxID=185542 RepID=A0ABC8QWX6_9AQUA
MRVPLLNCSCKLVLLWHLRNLRSSTRKGEIVVDLRAKIEPEANVPNETIEDVRKDEELISAKLQQMPNKRRKGRRKTQSPRWLSTTCSKKSNPLNELCMLEH